MVSGPSGLLRIDAAKTKLGKVKLIDEKVDHPYRVVFSNIIFQLSRKHCSLTAICTAYETAHPSPLLAGGILS
jgi:hypothetical protein